MLNQNIDYFDKCLDFSTLDSSYSNRIIKLYHFRDCLLDGWDLSYPNILIKEKKSDNIWYLPVKERFMSLNRDSNYESIPIWKPSQSHEITNVINSRPVFFFGYNIFNFYHFMYDSLPYLNGYLHLKQRGDNPLILLPSDCENNLPQFAKEIFDLLGINIANDLIYADHSLFINNLYVATSYTHDGKSGQEPHPNARFVLNTAVSKIKNKCESGSNLSNDLIYISRRTWAVKKTSNIGTDFTERRKFCNEDDLVMNLTRLGFKEVFMEHLNLLEKITLLNSAKLIVAPAGGGLANLLLSNPPTQVISINSPMFWSINQRLKYAFNHLNIIDFDDTQFTDFQQPSVEGTNRISAEGGLNSPWSCDLEKLVNLIRSNI